MIDSKQDEAVKLEACPVCGGEARVEVFSGDLIIGEARVWVCSNNRLLGGDCPDQNAYLSAEAWNTRTTPANLNAPDKQEALAGEGVYLRSRELEPTDFEVTKAALAILTADKDDLLAGDGYPEEAAEAFARAALMAAAPALVARCSRTADEALAGDDKNGVEGLRRLVQCLLDNDPDEPIADGGVTVLDQWRKDARAALSRTPSSPQADEADVERGIVADIAAMMSEFVENWPPHKKVGTSLALIAKTLLAALDRGKAETPETWEVRPCGNNFDVCVRGEPDAKGVAVVATVFAGEAVAEQIASAHNAAIGTMTTRPAGPIPMLLFCPSCGTKHVDEPDERTPDWTNPPHRSHLCHNPDCRTIWRPADVPTNGVARIETTGKADTVDLNEVLSLTRPAAGEEVDHG